MYSAIASENHSNMFLIYFHRLCKKSVLFFKNKPELISDWQSAICIFDRYTERFNCSLHYSITTCIKTMLVAQEHAAEDYFD